MRANLGNCKDNGSADDKSGLWAKTHDSCVGMHPGWEVPGMSAFREWCVPAFYCNVIDYETGGESAPSFNNSSFGGGIPVMMPQDELLMMMMLGGPRIISYPPRGAMCMKWNGFI